MPEFKLPKRSTTGSRATSLDLRYARKIAAEDNALALDIANIASGQIIRIAEQAAGVLGRRAKATLLDLFANPDALRDSQKTLEHSATIVRRFARLATQAGGEAAFAAFAGGAGVAVALAGELGSSDLPPPTILPPDYLQNPDGSDPVIEFPVIDRAVESLQAANVVDSATFYEASQEIRAESFTITADLEEKDLGKIRDLLAENVASNTSREDFMRDARDRVEMLGIADSHLEQVFRNNVNQKYSEGAEKALSAVLVVDHFPYRAYYAIRDDRVRDEHVALETLGLDGTNVYHRLDPVWLIFRPPWDWNCRCGFTPLSVRQASRRGVREATQWLETGVEPDHVFVTFPNFLPSESWQRIAV